MTRVGALLFILAIPIAWGSVGTLSAGQGQIRDQRVAAVPGLVWAAVTDWEVTRGVAVSLETRVGIIERVGYMTHELVDDGEQKGLTDAEFGKHVKFSTAYYMDLSYTLQSCGIPELTSPEECSWGDSLEASSLHESNYDRVLSVFRGKRELGYLTLKTQPEHGEITIDGQFRGYTIQTFALSPGPHEYLLVVPGAQQATCDGQIDIEPKRHYERSCPEAN